MRKEAQQIIYKAKAVDQSKNAIFVWIAIGLIYIIVSPSIKLISWQTLLLFLPGIFIASLLSMPLFLLKNKIALQVIEKGDSSKGKYIPLITFFDIVLAIVWPIVFLVLVNKWF